MTAMREKPDSRISLANASCLAQSGYGIRYYIDDSLMYLLSNECFSGMRRGLRFSCQMRQVDDACLDRLEAFYQIATTQRAGSNAR